MRYSFPVNDTHPSNKSIFKGLLHSLLQIGNALAATMLNFILMALYASRLGPERFGILVSSQAKILLWMFLADLGLYNGLVAALTRKEKALSDITMLRNVMFLRLCGAVAGIAVAAVMATSEARDRSEFYLLMAFSPYLLGFAFQNTLSAFGNTIGKQALCVGTNLIGLAFSVTMAGILLFCGYDVTTLLFAHSFNLLFSGILLYLGLQSSGSFKVFYPTPIVSKAESWLWLLWRDARPHAIIFAGTVLWQRLDQIFVERVFGAYQAGQYGLAVRIVAIPVLLVSAVSIALFPSVQRVGQDAPMKLCQTLGALLKTMFRFGLFLSAICLFVLYLGLSLFFKKYQAAGMLLVWFLPGVWFYWLQSFVMHGLLGLRKYREVVFAQVLSVLVFTVSLITLGRQYALPGVALSSGFYSATLFFYGYYHFEREANALGIDWKIWKPFSSFELELFRSMSQGIVKLVSGKLSHV